MGILEAYMTADLERVIGFVNIKLKCGVHQLDHTERVLRLALQISEDQEIDYSILIPAVYLHDVARGEAESGEKQTCHALAGSFIARDFLQGLSYSMKQVDQICHCIESHSYSGPCLPATPEAEVLFDADKLDGMGAVGIARLYAMSAHYGESLFQPAKVSEDDERVWIQPPHIEYEHKYSDLLNKLYTKKAKELAKVRLKFMALYFDQLKAELLND